MSIREIAALCFLVAALSFAIGMRFGTNWMFAEMEMLISKIEALEKDKKA